MAYTEAAYVQSVTPRDIKSSSSRPVPCTAIITRLSSATTYIYATHKEFFQSSGVLPFSLNSSSQQLAIKYTLLYKFGQRLFRPSCHSQMCSRRSSASSLQFDILTNVFVPNLLT